MNLKEIEKYWREAAEDSLDTAFKLLEQKKFVHSLFFLHPTRYNDYKKTFYKICTEELHLVTLIKERRLYHGWNPGSCKRVY